MLFWKYLVKLNNFKYIGKICRLELCKSLYVPMLVLSYAHVRRRKNECW